METIKVNLVGSSLRRWWSSFGKGGSIKGGSHLKPLELPLKESNGGSKYSEQV